MSDVNGRGKCCPGMWYASPVERESIKKERRREIDKAGSIKADRQG